MQTLAFYCRWNNFNLAKTYLAMNKITSFSVSKSDFALRSRPWVIYSDTGEATGFPCEVTFKTKKKAMAYLAPIVQWLNDNKLDIKITGI